MHVKITVGNRTITATMEVKSLSLNGSSLESMKATTNKPGWEYLKANSPIEELQRWWNDL